MVIDTSVLVHAAFRESGWQQSLHLLSRQPRLLLSSVSLVETHVVVRSRSSEDAEAVIDELLEALRVEVTPFGTAQASLARRAFNLYGKGQGHPAQLNFGDVVVYALAASRVEVLAFVGNDFNQTDLEVLRLPLTE